MEDKRKSHLEVMVSNLLSVLCLGGGEKEDPRKKEKFDMIHSAFGDVRTGKQGSKLITGTYARSLWISLLAICTI